MTRPTVGVLTQAVAEGYNDRELGDRYGVDPRTVRRWRHAYGLPTAYRPPSSGIDRRTYMRDYMRGYRAAYRRAALTRRLGGFTI